jgi:hypothetical protein
LIQCLLWTVYVLISLVMVASYQGLTGSLVAVLVAVGLALWGATEGLRAWALRSAWLDLPPRALLVRLLLVPPLMALGVQVLIALFNLAGLALGLLQFPSGTARGPGVFFAYTANTAIVLWLWLLGWAGAQWLQRWRQGEIAKWKAEAAARALELQVLRAQINPHFLFNALNNLRALINEDPARARDMLSRLSNTLRHTLQHSAKERVPLADELRVVRDYVALEQLHHEDRLQVHWDIEPATEGASLPPMLLQLLVENAIKHGIARTAGGGVLGIVLRRQGPRLTMAVSNPGVWQPGAAHRRGAPTDASPPSTGLGLPHLRERLQRAGGDGADCRIETLGGQVRVTVELMA